MTNSPRDGLVSEAAETYSVTVCRDDLEAARPLLHRFCILQNQAFEVAFQRVIGANSRQNLLVAAFVGAIASGVLALAAALTAEILWCGIMIIVTVFFCGAFVAQLTVGMDRIKAAIRTRFTDPLIRSRVNRQIDRTVKHTPFSVVYRFSDTSYTASVLKLKFERTVRGDEITVAYYAESVFCLFKNNKTNWKAIIYAPADEDRNVVDAFLKRNRVSVREPKPDPPSPESPVNGCQVTD